MQRAVGSRPEGRSSHITSKNKKAVFYAKEIFGTIKIGHENAVERPKDQTVDRELRDMISHFNHTNTRGQIIINIGDGQGYFIAAPNEDHLVREWMNQNKSRTGKCAKNVSAAKKYLNRDKQSELEKKPDNTCRIRNRVGGSEWIT